MNVPELKAEFFKSLTHPVRIRVLETLMAAPGRSVTEIQEFLEIEQSHLSHQLGVLRRSGFVVARREGSSVFYSLSDERIADLLILARQILLDAVTETQEQLETS